MVADRFAIDGGDAKKVYIVGGREYWPIGMVGLNPETAIAANYHAPAADTAAVVTKAAGGDGTFNVVGGIYWSYDDDPTGGGITIKDGATTVFSISITSGGTGFLPFTPPIRVSDNAALVVTLAAGGGTVVGKLSLNAWRIGAIPSSSPSISASASASASGSASEAPSV